VLVSKLSSFYATPAPIKISLAINALSTPTHLWATQIVGRQSNTVDYIKEAKRELLKMERWLLT